MSPSNPQNEFCYAKDYEWHYRKVHKPALGVYDGEPIMFCVWCGVALKQTSGLAKL